MKVLFLDNDGVICLSDNWGTRFKKYKKCTESKTAEECDTVENNFDNFDEGAIQVLNEILEATGAEIVVSSDWRRHANLEELGDYYTSKRIIKRPIGVTRFIQEVDDKLWQKEFRFYARLEQEREVEIMDWLAHHPEVTQWCAVDDLKMDNLKHFVHTPYSREGIKQSGVKEKIIKHLS